MEEDLVENIVENTNDEHDELFYLINDPDLEVIDDEDELEKNITTLSSDEQSILNAILRAGPIPITWVRGVYVWFWYNLDREEKLNINVEDFVYYIKNNNDYIKSIWNEKYPNHRWWL